LHPGLDPFFREPIIAPAALKKEDAEHQTYGYANAEA
jgi:hypothetical protein